MVLKNMHFGFVFMVCLTGFVSMDECMRDLADELDSSDECTRHPSDESDQSNECDPSDECNPADESDPSEECDSSAECNFEDECDLAEFSLDEQDCPSEGDKMILSVPRPWGEPYRAYKTLPEGFEIKNSTIPNAGLGVFTNQFIPAYTWLGEYEGEIVPMCNVSSYAFVVERNGKESYHVDAVNVETSSWQRFVNCPVHHRHENVVAHECRGRVYYMAGRDVYPGEELFVYYGDSYAISLGISIFKYHKDPPQQ